LVRSGRTPNDLAREFEPSAQAIRNWVALVDRDEGRREDGLTTAEREETEPASAGEQAAQAGARNPLKSCGSGIARETDVIPPKGSNS
jgi:transposase